MLVPSPNFQVHPVGFPVEVSVNLTVRGIGPVVGIPVKDALSWGALIVKVRDPEVPPPGEGLKTVTPAVPGKAMLAAGIEAVSRIEEI